MAEVIFAFDTEDFVTPESDDAAKMLAKTLIRHGLRGSFCVTGDKARSIVKRGRRDVIQTLKEHQINYHSNTHNLFPNTTLYIDKMNWDEGLNLVLKYEFSGVEAIKQIFDQEPIAYVKPGGNWAPQHLYAQRLLGLRIFADSHFEMLDGSPLWYSGMLLYRYHLSFERFFDEDEPFRRWLAAFQQGLKERERSGVPLVLYTHPCMWVTRMFFDRFNQPQPGHYPAKEKWQPAPLRPREKSRRLFRFFDEVASYIGKRKDIRVITYKELYERYKEPRGEWLTILQVSKLAALLLENLSYQRFKNRYLSAAEIFGLVSWALTQYAETKALPLRIPLRSPLGPVVSMPRFSGPFLVSSKEFLAAVKWAEYHIQEKASLPGRISLGETPLGPAPFIIAMARMLQFIQRSGRLPRKVKIEDAPNYLPEVLKILGKIRVGASSFPLGFKATGVKRQARRQSWTLKPALPTKK